MALQHAKRDAAQVLKISDYIKIIANFFCIKISPVSVYSMTDKGDRSTVSTRLKEKKEAENSDMNVIMAELRSHRDAFMTLQSQSDSLKSQINEVHTSLEKLLDCKVGCLVRFIAENKEELKAEMDDKVRQIQDNLNLDVGQLSARMERLEAKLDEAKRPAFGFHSDVSVIIVGLPFIDGEIPLQRVRSLLVEGLHCDPVPEIVKAERMKPRGRGPGVIKVELRSQQDKVAVLRRKQNFRENERFRRVFIHAAKSHAERLISDNFRTLLSELPIGKEYFLTGTGRLRRREQKEAASSDSRSRRSTASGTENPEN